MWRRRNANRPRRTRHPRPGRVGCSVADCKTCVCGGGYINSDLAQKCTVTLEHLNAVISAIGDVDVVLRIDGDTMWSVELPRLIAGFTPGLQPTTIFVDLRNSRIDVTIADISVARSVPGHVRYLAEESVFGGQRRLHLFQRSGPLVRSFLLATEDHGNPSFRIELDHHVRALIGDPDVVRRI